MKSKFRTDVTDKSCQLLLPRDAWKQSLEAASTYPPPQKREVVSTLAISVSIHFVHFDCFLLPLNSVLIPPPPHPHLNSCSRLPCLLAAAPRCRIPPLPHCTAEMDAAKTVSEPLHGFMIDSVRLVRRCSKPDRKGTLFFAPVRPS